MSFGRIVKKVAAVSAGAVMLGATLMGAMAADLSTAATDFASATVMYGASADASAATVVADALGATTTTTGSQDAVKIQTGSTELGIFQSVYDFGDTKISDSDSSWLADITVEDEAGTASGGDYEASVYVHTGNFSTYYSGDPGEGIPALFADLGEVNGITDMNTEAEDKAFALELRFSPTDLNAKDLDNSEDISILGQTYAFKDIGADSDVQLIGGKKVVVELGNPVTTTVDGNDVVVEVIGGDSGSGKLYVSVNGATATFSEGDTRKLSGYDVYNSELFVSNIEGAADGASAIAASGTFYIGKEGDTINLGPVSGSRSYTTAKDGGSDTIPGLYASIIDSSGAHNDTEHITNIYIAMDPSDTNIDYLLVGDQIKMPSFPVSLKFAEVVPEISENSEERALVEAEKAGNDFRLKFTTNAGDACNIKILSKANNANDDDTYNLTAYKDFAVATGAAGVIPKNDMFILEEDSGTNEVITRVYELSSFVAAENTANLKDVCAGTSDEYGLEEIGNTGVDIDMINESGISLNAATESRIYTKGNFRLNLLGDGAFPSQSATDDASIRINMTEDPYGGLADDITGGTYSMLINTDSNGDFNVGALTAVSGTVTTDDDESGNHEYGLTNYGTLYKRDGEDNEWIKIYPISNGEDADVFFEFILGSGEETTTVTPLAVSLIDDTSVLPTDGSAVILVGGPCVNKLTAEAQGATFPACGADARAVGYEEGEGMLKIVETDRYVAMIVAGWAEADTKQAAGAIKGASGTELVVTAAAATTTE